MKAFPEGRIQGLRTGTSASTCRASVGWASGFVVPCIAQWRPNIVNEGIGLLGAVVFEKVPVAVQENFFPDCGAWGRLAGGKEEGEENE